MPILRHLEPFLAEESYRIARLVASARGGSETAFTDLMNRYDAVLRAYLARRVDRDALEDVMQETRVACWQALPKFGGRSRFKAWMLGIAHHKSSDYHRRQYQIAAHSGSSLDDPTAIDLPDRFDGYHAADLRLLASSLLRQMPDAQREVLELYYFGDMTLEEVAGVLGRSLNTVKSQFYRAHARALSLLDERRRQGQPTPAGPSPKLRETESEDTAAAAAAGRGRKVAV